MQDLVKVSVEKFLEYVMKNHNVNREPATMLQAFQISLVRIIFLFHATILQSVILFQALILYMYIY